MPERLTSRSEADAFDPTRKNPDRVTYRSKWVVPDPWTVLENGYVQMAGSVVEAVGSGTPPGIGPVRDLGQGALIPPLVNAHTHLELSALRGMLPLKVGFRQWVSELLRIRSGITREELTSGAADGIRELYQTGCRVIAEISTLGITQDLLQVSSLSGIFFREHLGNDIADASEVAASSPFPVSMAVHAPHTTPPALICAIKTATSSRKLPMSVHLAESEDERLFITTGRGDWADFLTERGIDFSDWPLPVKSPVKYLDTLGVLDTNTLAVHLIDCSPEDLEILRSSNTTICFCPRSNRLLHQKLPDIPSFLSAGFRPCIGSDSLASSPSLSILDEMSFIVKQYVNITPNDILSMGTLHGAVALGLEEKFGRLAPGFGGPPVYVPIQTCKRAEVIQAIVSSGNADINLNKRNFIES